MNVNSVPMLPRSKEMFDPTSARLTGSLRTQVQRSLLVYYGKYSVFGQNRT